MLIYGTNKGNLISHKFNNPKENHIQIHVKSDFCMRLKQNPFSESKFLIASKEHPLQIWDINTQKNLWTAKRLPNDKYDLMSKIWDTDCIFHRLNDEIIYTCTAYSYVFF